MQVERPALRPGLQFDRVEDVQGGRSSVGPFLGLRLAIAACTLLRCQQVRGPRPRIAVVVVDLLAVDLHTAVVDLLVVDPLVVDLHTAVVVLPGLRGKEVDLAKVPKIRCVSRYPGKMSS